MRLQTICKTVHQYNKYPVSNVDMNRLEEIAEDYKNVKNHVYARFGGTKSLAKLYPGYTIQNEMTKSGLRQKMGLPAVYFYLAIFDALADIKSQWTMTKSKIMKLVGENESLTAEEKHYIRFALSVSNVFEALLNQHPVGKLPIDIKRQYEALAGAVEEEKMKRYICRQVRKHKCQMYADTAQGFSASERAYRYGDGGIYISTKEPRKRVFIPLTDTNQYQRQLYVKLFPEEKRIEIRVPVNVRARVHPDYTNKVGIALGMNTMLTTDGGHDYGVDLGKLHYEYANWIHTQTGRYNRNRAANPGRRKYYAEKNRYEERLHSYINQELNRFFRMEKPKVVYIVKLPKPQAQIGNKRGNHYLSMWQRGYIRKRLLQKCVENSVDIIEVLGKDISRECSVCGGMGVKEKGIYTCKICGYEEKEKINTAKNIKKRGETGKILN